MRSIYKREIASYLHGVLGWLFAAILLLFAGLFTASNNLLAGIANINLTLNSLILILAILCPLVTMRSFAEERRNRTEQLLYALPLSMGRIVCGKYLALLTVLGAPVALITLFSLFLRVFGKVSFAATLAGAFSFFLLGAALLALCMYISSKTEHLLVSAIVGFVALILLFLCDVFAALLPATAVASFVGLLVLTALCASLIGFLTASPLGGGIFGCVCAIVLTLVFLFSPASVAGLLPRMLRSIALFSRFVPLAYGILDLSTWIMYLSFAAFFLLLTVLSMEKRRYA